MITASKSEKDRLYRIANKPKGELYRFKKRAKKHNAIHDTHDQNIELIFHEMRYRLEKCIGIPYVVDHILPLERNGYHHHKNLQVIPTSLQKEKRLSLSFNHPSLIHWTSLSDDMISHVINLEKVQKELNGFIRCSSCKQVLSPTSFYKKFKNSNILHLSCKDCMSSRTKKWKETNIEYVKDKQNKYWEKNKHKYKETSKNYKKKHKDRISEQMKIWNKNNKHLKSVYQNKREAIKHSQYHQEHNSKIEEVLLLMSSRISKCCNIPHNVDHILPLSMGGYHHHLNLQVIPASLNFKKKNDLTFTHPTLIHWTNLPDHLLSNIKQ